jgi:putative sterol carrier protein
VHHTRLDVALGHLLRVARGVPLEIDSHRSWDAVPAAERLIRIVEGGPHRLVADRPLGERHLADVLGPELLTLHQTPIGSSAHLEIGDMNERSVGQDHRRPVPQPMSEQSMGADHPGLTIGFPDGEDPFVDATVVGALVGGGPRHRGQTRPMTADSAPDRIRYLSLAWIRELSAAVAESERLAELAAEHRVAVTQIVTATPEGDVAYHLRVADGSAAFGAGPADDEDIRMQQDWDTAVAVATGELNAQEAFVTGRILLTGDRELLMSSLEVFAALDSVFAEVRTRTDYT